MHIENLVEEGLIQASPEMNHVAFLLSNNRMFLNSDYRFMRGQELGGLLRCMKATQNGKIKLIYPTDGFRPLSVIYGWMNFSAFMSIIEAVFSTIQAVENNGFLKPGNIDDSLEHVFVDSKTLETKILYLPIQARESDPEVNHMALRTELVRLIHATPFFTGSDVQQACRYLENEMLSVSDVKRELQNIRVSYGSAPRVYDEDDPVYGTKQLAANIRLVSRDPSYPQTFHIHKSEFILGKSQEKADGIIPKSTVSRIHCAVYYVDGVYFIEDLDSTNGTKLNHERIPSRQRRQLMNGDILSIAGTEYLVEY